MSMCPPPALLLPLLPLLLLPLLLSPRLGADALRAPPNARLVRKCRHGDFFVMRRDQYVGQSLASQGEWGEGEVQQVFRRFVREGDTVVDVGANIGAFTVPLAKLAGPRGVVHAIEPIRSLFNLMVANTVVNGLSNVQAHHAYAGSGLEGTGNDHNDDDNDAATKNDALPYPPPDTLPTLNIEVLFEPGSPFNSGAEMLNFGSVNVDQAALPHGTRGVDIVRTVPIDELGLFACDFIKVDVEGNELAVLEGARETLERFRPVVYMEADREDKNPALLRFMHDEVGYVCIQHRVPLYNHANFRDADPWAEEVAWVRGRSVMSSHNVLCVHRGRTEEDAEEDEEKHDDYDDDYDDDYNDDGDDDDDTQGPNGVEILAEAKTSWGRDPFGAPAPGEEPRPAANA